MVSQNRRCELALKGGEPENASLVEPKNELHCAVAKPAQAVVE